MRAGADQRAGRRLPDSGVAHRHRLRQRGGAVAGDAADEIAVIAVEQVQVAFAIDDTEIVTDDDRSAGKADGELVLFPDRRTGGLVERVDGALVVGDVEVAGLNGNAAEAREIARPEQRSTEEIEAGDASLVRRGAGLPRLDHG